MLHRISCGIVLSVVLIMISMPLVGNAANRVSFSIKNRQAANGTYSAELWAEIATGVTWDIISSNIALAYNTSALSGQMLTTAFEANALLTANGVVLSQSVGTGFLRINMLKFPGQYSVSSGSLHIATYQWTISDGSLKDELAFVTTGSSTIVFNGATQLDFNTGNSNGYGAEDPVSLTVDGLDIELQPQNTAVCAGDDAEFGIKATGASLTFQWEKSSDAGSSWNDVAGATTTTITISSAQSSDNGTQYRCVVSSASDIVTSNSVTLTVNLAPGVNSQPSEVAVCVEETALFTVRATGNPSPAIQWQASTDSGASWGDVSGATTTTLTLTNVQAVANGNLYRARLHNTCATVFSTEAALFVTTLPTIVVEPMATTAAIGADAVFTAELSGEGNIFQWFKDGVALHGATAASLTIGLVRPGDAGDYFLEVSNACGVIITSSSVSLSVVQPAVVSAIAYIQGYWNGLDHRRTSVLLELYDGASPISAVPVASQAGIVAHDGSVSVQFVNVSDGSYWLVLRHGGHLAIVSAAKVAITAGSTTLHDFSSTSNVFNGANAMDQVNLNGTLYNVLKAGDLNGDLSVGADDFLQLLLPNFGASNPGSAPSAD